MKFFCDLKTFSLKFYNKFKKKSYCDVTKIPPHFVNIYTKSQKQHEQTQLRNMQIPQLSSAFQSR